MEGGGGGGGRVGANQSGSLDGHLSNEKVCERMKL